MLLLLTFELEQWFSNFSTASESSGETQRWMGSTIRVSKCILGGNQHFFLFLTCYPVMLRLLVQAPHFENHFGASLVLNPIPWSLPVARETEFRLLWGEYSSLLHLPKTHGSVTKEKEDNGYWVPTSPFWLQYFGSFSSKPVQLMFLFLPFSNHHWDPQIFAISL